MAEGYLVIPSWVGSQSFTPSFIVPMTIVIPWQGRNPQIQAEFVLSALKMGLCKDITGRERGRVIPLERGKLLELLSVTHFVLKHN